MDLERALADLPDEFVAKVYATPPIVNYPTSVAATVDGTVFVAGTTDWVVGLDRRNFFVEQITRNVLDRLGGDRPA